MNNLQKATAILFSLVLFCMSLITENFLFLLNSNIHLSDQESLLLPLPIRTSDLLFINRNGENLVAFIKLQPVFNLKDWDSAISVKTERTALSKLIINSEYLQFSGTISRNLTNTDIVFPFHNFW